MAAVSVMLAAIFSAQVALAREHHPPAPELISEQLIGPYVARVYRDTAGCGGEFFEIARGLKVVYSTHGHCQQTFRVGALESSDVDDKFLAPGSDVTGDGSPNLVVSAYTGGANCCLSYYVFDIGTKFRLVDTLHLEQDEHAAPHLVRLEDGHGLQVITHDWTFSGWHASPPQSPAPLVILHYRDGAFHVDEDLMREPAMSLGKLQAEASPVRWRLLTGNADGAASSWPSAKVSPDLWESMLSLIYAGHEDLAWKYLDYAWPGDVRGKEKFAADFRKQLALSPYWKEISAMQPEPEAKPSSISAESASK
ncbi:MAG TPA: hypothetical protein VEJ86_12695 [Candidatus Binataceae bacterium]|nr:hypothetical protein [Candidatus Binataceae bacterium]